MIAGKYFDKDKFAGRLKNARIEHGWSRRQLAEKSNVSYSSVKEYENDKNTAIPSLLSVMRLSVALNRTLDHLTGISP